MKIMTKEERLLELLNEFKNGHGHIILDGIDFETSLVIKNCKVDIMDVRSNEVEYMYVHFNEVANGMNVYDNEVANYIAVRSNKVANYMAVLSNKVANYMNVRYNEANNMNVRYNEPKNMDVYSNEAKNMNVRHNEVENNQFYPDYAIFNGKKYDVDNTDGYYLMVEKSQTRNGVTIIEGISTDNKKIYLYKNDLVGYHARTKQDAKDGFKLKLKGIKENEELVNKIKKQGYITREEYHQLTNACDVGIQAFAERIGKPNEDKLSLQDLEKYLQPSDWGYVYMKQYFMEENNE